MSDELEAFFEAAICHAGIFGLPAGAPVLKGDEALNAEDVGRLPRFTADGVGAAAGAGFSSAGSDWTVGAGGVVAPFVAPVDPTVEAAPTDLPADACGAPALGFNR